MVYLMDVQTLKDRSNIDNNTDNRTVKLALRDCQQQILEPAIGTKLYEKFTTGIADGYLELDYQNLIVQKVWPVLIHGTEYMIARRLLMRYTNSAVVTDSNQNSTAVTLEDLNVLRAEAKEAYLHHVNMLKLYLTTNQTTYPEYGLSDTDDLHASPNVQPMPFYYDGKRIKQ